MEYMQSIFDINTPADLTDFVAQLRPRIDATLQRFNLSPRNIGIKMLADKRTASVRFNISSGVFVSKDSDSAGTKVIFRVTKRDESFSAAVPTNRLRFYIDCGRTQESDSGWVRIDFDGTADISKFSSAITADIEDQLLHYPSTFSCCGSYRECSIQGHCIAANQDFAAGCYYKRNLLSGKNFYNAKTDSEETKPQ